MAAAVCVLQVSKIMDIQYSKNQVQIILMLRVLHHESRN